MKKLLIAVSISGLLTQNFVMAASATDTVITPVPYIAPVSATQPVDIASFSGLNLSEAVQMNAVDMQKTEGAFWPVVYYGGAAAFAACVRFCNTIGNYAASARPQILWNNIRNR